MWESDYDGGAIFRIDTGKGKLVRFYIEGLEPTGAPRGHFDGFWISTSDEGLCSAELAGPDGTVPGGDGLVRGERGRPGDVRLRRRPRRRRGFGELRRRRPEQRFAGDQRPRGPAAGASDR